MDHWRRWHKRTNERINNDIECDNKIYAIKLHKRKQLSHFKIFNSFLSIAPAEFGRSDEMSIFFFFCNSSNDYINFKWAIWRTCDHLFFSVQVLANRLVGKQQTIECREHKRNVFAWLFVYVWVANSNRFSSVHRQLQGLFANRENDGVSKKGVCGIPIYDILYIAIHFERTRMQCNALHKMKLF